MRIYAFVLVCFLISMKCDHCSSKRIICEDVEESVENTDFSVSISKCPPGEKGSKGAWGSHGVTGIPGEVDYERIGRILTEKVSEETHIMKIKIDEISEKIRNLVKLTPPLPASCDGVAHNGRCFWAEVHPDDDTTFYDAYEICKRKNYELANIINEGQYNAVVQYLESMLVQRTYIHIWTGMRKTYKEFDAQLANGAQLNFTRPRSDNDQWNEAGPKRTHAYIHGQYGDWGIGAIWPSYSLLGALCQYHID